jgi:hypothetical protein
MTVVWCDEPMLRYYVEIQYTTVLPLVLMHHSIVSVELFLVAQ